MAILIDSYSGKHMEDFSISTSYIRLNKLLKKARNIFGIITNKYSVKTADEIKEANNNQSNYVVNGMPIWVTAKPLNKSSIKTRCKNIISYMKNDKICVFYYKDYNFNMGCCNG